jgi:hypothetical protein
MRKEFEVHLLNEIGIENAKTMAFKFSELLDWLNTIGVTPSREMSLVATKLEEACFFAKKAMANKPENQK